MSWGSRDGAPVAEFSPPVPDRVGPMSDSDREEPAGLRNGSRGTWPWRRLGVLLLAILIAVVLSTTIVSLLGYSQVAFPQVAVSTTVAVIMTAVITNGIARRRQ